MMTDIPITEGLTRTVPRQIARTLARLIRRNRAVILFRGLGATAATAVAALLIVMAIDASVTLFAAWPRWALTLSALSATVAAAVLYLFRPLARSFTLTAVARVIEDRHPELQERLSSAVELLTSQDGPEIRGSDALIAMLAAEATLDARSVRPRKEVTFRPALPFLAAAVAVIGLLSGLYTLWPRRTMHLLKRALAPGANLPNVQAHDLRLTPDHDVTIAEGDRLVVALEVANPKVTRATLRKVTPDGEETAEPMVPLGAGRGGWKKFTLTCAPATGDFRFRAHAGDALTQYIHVTVVPRPAIARIDLLYEFPAYTRRGPQTVPNFQDVDDGRGKISAVAGTTVTVTASCNTPLSGAEVLINDEPIDPGAVSMEPDGRTFKARILLKPKLAGICTLRPLWALKLAETRSPAVEAQDGEQYDIEALRDERPGADLRVRKIDGKLKLKPTDSLPFGYTFTDDQGLTRTEILVRVDGRKQPPIPLELPPAGAAGILRLSR